METVASQNVISLNSTWENVLSQALIPNSTGSLLFQDFISASQCHGIAAAK